MVVGRIIVDGDPIVYRAAFAAQHTVYEAMLERPSDVIGHMDMRHLVIKGDPRDELKALGKEGWMILDRWHTVVASDDFRLLEMMVDSQLKGIFNHCTETLGVPCRMELILSGKGNYRNAVATIMGYKANRLKTEKPVHHKYVTDYLRNSWNAYVVDGREADDEVSIRMRRATQMDVPCILATIDKDLDQIPGKHYDYKSHVTYDVGEEEAVQLFYAQILCGDAVDNIPGCAGLGAQKSKALIAECVDAWGVDEELLWDAVVNEYTKRGIKGYWHAADGPRSAEDVALEVARLVKLQEYAGQLWSPPGIDDELVEGNADD